MANINSKTFGYCRVSSTDKKGVPTKIIQKLLRHGRASITEDIYIDIDNTSDFVKQELNRVFAT